SRMALISPLVRAAWDSAGALAVGVGGAATEGGFASAVLPRVAAMAATAQAATEILMRKTGSLLQWQRCLHSWACACRMQPVLCTLSPDVARICRIFAGTGGSRSEPVYPP